jgi:ArsR family transcriptional regulator
VGDLGAGTGAFSAAVAPFVSRVIAVDESAPMLAAARARLAGFGNVELREGELELLPVREAELDLAALVLVLPFVPDPGRVIAEAAHALEAGGRILVLDLQPHERAHYSQAMGHLWHGFSQGQMQAWMTGAGLRDVRYVALPPLPDAKGPGLFVATAAKPE